MPDLDMKFSPPEGLRNDSTYVPKPGSRSAAKEQIQGRMDELKDDINNSKLKLMLMEV